MLAWPVREALLAYVELIRSDARDQYDREMLIFAIQSPYLKKGTKPPKRPRLLED